MTDISVQARKNIVLEAATLGANLAGGCAALAAGHEAGSIALVCCGLASLLDVASGAPATWKARQPTASLERGQAPAAFERWAHFVTGAAFFVLMLYVLHEAGSRLSYAEKPEKSFAGLIVSLALTPVLTVLALLKLSTARILRSRAASASASLTMNSAAVAAILGFGLAFHLGRGWWWADPVASLAMLPFLCRSGWQSVELGKAER